MSRSLLVPDIGTDLTLAEDWTFVLVPEYRNDKLWTAAGLPNYGHSQAVKVKRGDAPGEVFLVDEQGTEFVPQVTLPKGTVLRCARVYIRNGKNASNFSSLTWTIKKCPDKTLKGRFWARLHDCNNMIVE